MGQLVTRTLGTLPRGDREDTKLTRALGEMGWLGLQIVKSFLPSKFKSQLIMSMFLNIQKLILRTAYKIV